MRPNDIAIIGCGFSGILTAWRLSRSRVFDGRIVLLEGDRPLGAAYATASPWHVLNTPADRMSALPEAPDHFHRFAKRVLGPVAPDAYLPRQLYGRYLARLRGDAIANGVVCRPVSATAIRGWGSSGFVIDCSEGPPLPAQEVVLAVGAGTPVVPRGLEELVGARGFFVDPWLPAACEPPDDGGGVALIGTGQTAIDVALDLVRRGHRGRITAISRHGLLPGVREPGRAPAAAIDFATMPTTSAVTLMRWWRRQIAAVGNTQAAHAALRGHNAACWEQIHPTVRDRLLRHARPFWEVDRHRLAPVVAERLNTHRAADRLEFRAGRLRGGMVTQDGFMLEWQPRGPATSIETRCFTRVINCTGFGGFAGAKASPLLEPLLEAGLIRAGAHGLGIESTHDRLHIAGALRRGAEWETTAVPELALRCRQIAAAIIAQHQTSVATTHRPLATAAGTDFVFFG